MWHIYVYTHTFQSSMKQNSYLLRNVVIGEIHPGRLMQCSARPLKPGLYQKGEDREKTV